MPIRDRLLAILVALVWGVNFTAIHVSLAQFPPFFLAALRFAVVAVPTLLLVPRPAVSWRWLIGYGAGFGVAQFLFLYWAMATGMPAGLASLVLQSSAPFTVLLAGLFLRERVTARQASGVALAVCGLAGIAVHRGQVSGGAALAPFVLTLCAGAGWAVGNLAARRAGTTEPFRLMLWMTVIPPLPMLALSLAVEGPGVIGRSLTTLGSATGAVAVAGLVYTVVIATIGGSGAWTALMSRHPSSAVAPFSMLVPVAGIGASWLLLHERTSAVELASGAVVLAGVLWGSRRADRARVHAAAGERDAAAGSTPARRALTLNDR